MCLEAAYTGERGGGCLAVDAYTGELEVPPPPDVGGGMTGSAENVTTRDKVGVPPRLTASAE